ncbi:E3 ubiquitin-protein ligase TRIM21-like [Pholidichthys leucotaenia]
MAAASFLLTEDHLLCSICLEVFTDPVSTPCGHNFCKDCITGDLNLDVPLQCPFCNQMFYPKPELKVNTLISEMVDAFRSSAHDNHEPEQASIHEARPCAVCTDTKRKALYFCCVFIVLAHMIHSPLQESSKKLMKTDADIQQMIQEAQLKIEEIRRSLEVSRENTEQEISEGIQVFKSLKEAADRGQAELMETIREKQRHTELQAEGFIKKLEEDILELKKKRAEVQLLSAAQLEEELSEEEILKMLARSKMKKLQQYKVDVMLDPDTANPFLILSDDGKQVVHGDKRKFLPNNPERFSHYECVLGQQGFSSGRFYFEVQVKGKPEWYLGVATASTYRKGKITLSPEDGYWTVRLRDEDEYKALEHRRITLHLHSAPEKVGVFVDYENGLVSFYDVDTAALIYSYTGWDFEEKLYPFFNPGVNYDGTNSAPLIVNPVR